MKWTERWIARAQRKADLRAERFLRQESSSQPPLTVKPDAALGSL